jgi:hypothetical protein
MPFDFNVWQRNAVRRDGIILPRIHCADGFSMSVQASEWHYCTPREHQCDGYFTVEIGFPSEPVAELLPYAEIPDTPTETVYARVPVTLVNEIVNAHGGVRQEAVK